MEATVIELTSVQAAIGIVVAIVGFATTFAGLVKVWTKGELMTKRLEEIMEQQKMDCATWRSSCLGHRRDDHDTFRSDIREMRAEFKSLRDCVSAQTAALGITNQRLQDLIDTMQVAK